MEAKANSDTSSCNKTGDGGVLRLDVLLNSDAWDDTALIEAWDASMNHYKGMRNNSIGKKATTSISTTTTSATSTAAVGRSSSKSTLDSVDSMKTSPSPKRRAIEWKIGDECEALWENDEEYYDAVVLAVYPERGEVKVKYLGYDEIAVVPMKSIQPLSTDSSSPSHQRLLDKSTNGKAETSTDTPASSSTSVPRSNNKIGLKRQPQQQQQSPSPQSHYPSGTIGNNFSTGSMYDNAYYPSFHHPYSSFFRSPSFFPSSSNNPLPFMPSVPPMPPVPPPYYQYMSDPPTELPEDEDLKNLLMAWYFSGYYAGLYKAKTSQN